MVSPSSMELLATLIVIVVGVTFFWPPKTRLFTRRGWDPGCWDLKLWPARVHFFFKGHDVTEAAYREAKDDPYMLQTLIEDVLVLPPRYLSELRMLPRSKFSASDALVVSVLGQYSGVDVILKDRQTYDVLRIQLTKSLPNLLPTLSQKANQVLSEKLDILSTSDYSEINIYNAISDLVLRTSLSAFVGPDLADNTELHALVNAHANLVRDIAICLLFVPTSVRRWIRPLLPPSIRMRRLHKKMREILFNPNEVQRSERPPDVLLQHLIDTSDTADEEDIVAKILVICGAALHTMVMSTVHAIIDLCAYPDRIVELRQEVFQHLSPAPPWSTDAIARCRRLDAFLKESQRLNAPNYLSFDRLAMEPITLSSGITIPRRTYVCMPADSMATDPSFYASPELFSPSRFHDPPPDTPKGHLDFVGTESGYIHWGSGRFTCPGRWYASAMMKVFVALVVSRYDVRFPGGQVERLPNVYMDLLVEPNPKQRVLLKRREESATRA